MPATRSTQVDIAAIGAGLEVAITVEDGGTPCRAVGVLRVVRLSFAEPVAPAMVKVTQ